MLDRYFDETNEESDNDCKWLMNYNHGHNILRMF